MHARDCAECEGRQGRIDRMHRSISITGDMTDAQRDRLLAVADRCPVHKTLTASMVIIDR